ncbi:MAG: hypothetical protein HY831_04185, partial [Candidatus Aenigmarchaeota archaeon]|nr:hypothetical protein [Candidatus Aenigmarchaeota archaeon]
MLAEEQLIGNYRIVSLIDRAQFNVYRAIDSSGREVAIKSLGAYSNTNDVQRQSFVAKDTITLVEEADI